MAISISYMGTKRRLAPVVADIISDCPSGPLLDLFSGMCAVGSVVGPQRQIWCNDIQHFAATVATAFFTSKELPLSSIRAADLVFEAYSSNRDLLRNRFEVILEMETDALLSGTVENIANFYDTLPHVGHSSELNRERKRLSKKPSTFPYRLFSITFAGGYLSLEQSIQVDSIRYAIDKLLLNYFLSHDQHRWMVLALGQAICKISTTTGHFAQYLKINSTNAKTYIRQRNRSIWREWLLCLDNFSPVGTKVWRSNNKVFRKNCVELLKNMADTGKVPSVVYADPPYTSDQYSRYYHLYETLLLYDYPLSHGEGRYRPDRFRSAFSIKTEVLGAIDSIAYACSKLGSSLVMSYPQNGLLPNSAESIISSMRRYFKRCDMVKTIGYNHSSLGGSKGHQVYPVTEMLFLAR